MTVSPAAWIACLAWLAATATVAARRGARGLREGRGRLFARRLKSPTVYLFAAYLFVAGLVTPRSPGESTSPLLGLAVAIPLCWALAGLSSIGDERPRLLSAVALAALHAGALAAAAAIVLAIASPQFVPAILRAR